jgi:uncharacterized protein YcbX
VENGLARAIGRVTNLWTYPVKSLHHVAHDAIEVVEDGLLGDRRAALFVATEEHARSGKPYRGKEDNRLHLLHGPEEARDAAQDRGVDLVVRNGERYYDAGDVSLIFDRWVAEVERGLGRTLDPLRWRPNLYAAASSEFSEKDLVGVRLQIGEVVLRVVAPTGRCVTTTYDQETGESDGEVLRFVAKSRDNTMGVYCTVEQTGKVSVGDRIILR